MQAGDERMLRVGQVCVEYAPMTGSTHNTTAYGLVPLVL